MIVYRCSRCGKWSHAKRQPKFHQRFISADSVWPELSPDLPVISQEDGWADDHGNGQEGGWWVRCGPFETYEAVLVP